MINNTQVSHYTYIVMSGLTNKVKDIITGKKNILAIHTVNQSDSDHNISVGPVMWV